MEAKENDEIPMSQLIMSIYDNLVLKINNNIYKQQVNFMENDYQEETDTKFYLARHGLAGPAINRELKVINGAGAKRNPDPKFHEIIAERDHIGLIRYVQENYPESIGVSHHPSLYNQDGTDTKVVMVVFKNENRSPI